ncbi:MAG TPA: hypothetical protein VJQ78_01375 [Sphingobium sp.]|nr:hypothetical protein [Sphingobium sp.]
MTGFWVAGLTLVLLLSVLPWADVWGSGFKFIRAKLDHQDCLLRTRAAAIIHLRRFTWKNSSPFRSRSWR